MGEQTRRWIGRVFRIPDCLRRLCAHRCRLVVLDPVPRFRGCVALSLRRVAVLRQGIQPRDPACRWRTCTTPDHQCRPFFKMKEGTMAAHDKSDNIVHVNFDGKWREGDIAALEAMAAEYRRRGAVDA